MFHCSFCIDNNNESMKCRHHTTNDDEKFELMTVELTWILINAKAGHCMTGKCNDYILRKSILTSTTDTHIYYTKI